MKRSINGKIVEITLEEINAMQVEAEQHEREYLRSISYDEAVNEEIRKRYSASQEFAILRQKEEKPKEYEEYYSYCESCKAYVKAKRGG